MKFLLFFLLLSAGVHAFEMDYSHFSTPEELIVYEKNRLQESTLEGEALAEAYMDLGESYLLSEQYELALEHLSAGYEIAQNCIERKEHLPSRALFGLAITYANLDRLEESYFAIETMEMQLRRSYCQGCEEVGHIILMGLEEPPILGADTVSIKECMDRVRGTINRANELISFVKRAEVQFILRNIIADLGDRSIRCCQSGGVWKACLRPLVNKWYKWNEKWRLFGIPPDPAWD